MYEDGRGVEQSYEEAIKWYRLVAGYGDVNTSWFFSDPYKDSRGVELSDEEAVKRYRFEAWNKLAYLKSLGSMYEDDTDIDQSDE